MRIATLKLLLAAIGGSTELLLGAPTATAGSLCPPDTDLYLHANPNPSGPPDLVLVTIAPSGSVANYLDSPALKRTGQYPYPYTDIGDWDDGYVGCSLSTCGPPPQCLIQLSALHVWLGLRNSDDQGTNFDLRAEVSFRSSLSPSTTPPTLIATGEKTCIKGLTRNPSLAQEIIVDLPQSLFPSGDGEFFLNLSARIASPACGGHTSATGLRVYYDSSAQDSHFDVHYPQ